MTEKLRQLKSNLRNNILIAFFIISVIGGAIINLIFQNVIHTTLAAENLNAEVIENICRYFTIISSGITITAIIICFFVTLFITESITRPVCKLTSGLINIAEGKWDTRIHVSNTDEIGQLADGFNFMADNIENALKKLKEAKDYTDNIIVSVPSILIILSNRLNILSTNIAFENLSEQFPTLTLKQFIHPLEEEIRKNLATGEIMRKELELVPEGSNTSLYFSAVVSTIGSEEKDENEEKARVLLTITNITERKRMKELVMQSKQDWEDTFNTIPDIITIHDREYNIIYANKAAREVLGMPLLKSGKLNKCYKFYHGTETVPKGCPSCNSLHSEMPVTFETYEPHLKKFIEIRSIPRINDRKEVIGLIHIVRDISERKEIEQEHNNLLAAVTKAKMEWETTFDSVKELIVLLDNDFRITRCNRSFSVFAGATVDKLIGRSCHEYFSCSHEEFSVMVEHANNLKEPVVKKEIRTEKNRWLYLSFKLIYDKNRKFIFSVVVATDVTELKYAQQKLKESEEELKKRVKELEKFYDMAVGRELRMKDLKREIKKLKNEISEYREKRAV